VTIEKNMADFLVEYIKKYDDLTLLLPANIGFEESSVNSLSADYNQLVIERNKIIQGSNENNPIAKRIEAQLLSIRESLDNTLTNVQNRLKIQIEELLKREKEYNRKIKSVPELERRYREIARQQQIKETLYLYLLQKREENQLAMASTMGTIKVLNPPSTSWRPISPNRSSTFFRAFLIGLAIPIGVIYLLGVLDNKVRSKEDLEGIGIPLVGEIPENKSGESLVVQKGERSMVAEAFRMLRANISFLIPDREKKGNVIYVSSTIAGEGKTFNAINLASSFALTGKKVVLMGMDLRAPKLSQYLGITDQAGVSNFVIDESISVADITIPSGEVPNLSYILSGIIPPNPSELLLSPRITSLFNELKKDYDYIIVDNAPTALVADVANIAEFADVFLYVVRANYLNKRDLQVPVKLKEEMEVKKLAFILNSTKYGLNGYNGYGYGYGEKGVYGEESKSWWRKLKRGD
jgi:capsular exopolysaccharide synthesis family protein